MIRPLNGKSAPVADPGEPTILEGLITDLGFSPEKISCDDLQLVAEKLSKIAGKDDPWSWRYMRQVLNGQIKPSKVMEKAIIALGSTLDGIPAVLANTHQVTVQALGNVRPGTIIYGDSIPCGNPACKLFFIPKVWNQSTCGAEACKKAVRKLRAKKDLR